MTDVVGQTLGQYRVESLIGQGGMARVYRGFQPSLERYVAIKAIPLQVNGQRDETFAQRFTMEAKLIARLTHPNIVPIHDYGEDRGWAFIVMEFISGGTVRDQLVAAEAARTGLDLVTTLDLMAQAALALEGAHAKGVIHRDVKPGNMLLRTRDHLLLSDFGIAAILEANQAYVRTGANIGTPQYMAPEQGIPNGVIDARTDIYALGVVLFQCVTGRLPFDADTPMGTVLQHIQQPPPRPSLLVPGLPPKVEYIILRAMEKHPGMRFQRAREMADYLRDAATEVRRSGRPPNPTVRRETGPVASAPYQQMPMQRAARGIPGAPGTCLRCGAANNPQNHFCTTCGYDLSGARARSDRHVLPNGNPLRCRILVRNGPLAGCAYLLHQDATTLGRSAENDVSIPDGTISRHHARLSFKKGHWLLEDLGSSNGSFVNGQRVTSPKTLNHGDEVRLGDDVLTFELVG